MGPAAHGRPLWAVKETGKHLQYSTSCCSSRTSLLQIFAPANVCMAPPPHRPIHTRTRITPHGGPRPGVIQRRAARRCRPGRSENTNFYTNFRGLSIQFLPSPTRLRHDSAKQCHQKKETGSPTASPRRLSRCFVASVLRVCESRDPVPPFRSLVGSNPTCLHTTQSACFQ